MDKIAVLIPCYNEEKTIAKVVSDVKKFLPQAVAYVYDNNSTDRTVELATEAGAIVRYEYAQGKGNVIRRMFREIDAECYLMIDGDDTYPLDCAQEMVDRVLQHQADMVVGDRLSSTYFTENKRPFHNFGNSLMRAGINSLFHANIKDIMTGYRAFSYEFVKTFPVFSKGFEIETEMTIHAVNYNMQVENVVVEYRDRPQGSESKLNTYSDGFRVIRKMMQLYKNYKPLHFFGMLALLLIAVSVILFVPVFLEYLNTGLVPRFPTLIACGFILLAGIQSFFAGMMLEVMAAKDRKDFEYRLNRVHGEHQSVKGCNMQEKKILPRRKGVVLLSVLGCLFVFFAKQKRPGICGKHPVDGRLHRKYFAVDGSAGVPSGISWNLGGASTLEPGTDRRRHREKAGCMVCPHFLLAAAPLRCADIFRKSVVSAVGLAAGISGILSRDLCL